MSRKEEDLLFFFTTILHFLCAAFRFELMYSSFIASDPPVHIIISSTVEDGMHFSDPDTLYDLE